MMSASIANVDDFICASTFTSHFVVQQIHVASWIGSQQVAETVYKLCFSLQFFFHSFVPFCFISLITPSAVGHLLPANTLLIRCVRAISLRLSYSSSARSSAYVSARPMLCLAFFLSFTHADLTYFLQYKSRNRFINSCS